MEKQKTRSFVPKNRKQNILLHVKILLCSEISLCSEIALHSENFAIIAKISLCRKISLSSPACILHIPACIQFYIQFLHSRLDVIEYKSYELGVNQLNFDMLSLIW